MQMMGMMGGGGGQGGGGGDPMAMLKQVMGQFMGGGK